jgi:hypothetical protein
MATKKQCETCKATVNDMGATECEFCLGSSFVHITVADDPAPLPPTGLDTPAGMRIIGRKPKQQLAVVERLVKNLTAMNKYSKAIKHGEVAAFSFIGTDDWEDYASLSVNARNALTMANISRDLSEIRKLLEKQTSSGGQQDES